MGDQGRNVMDLFSLTDRTVIVTGGAGGLGYSFAKACTQAGANIALLDIAAEPSSTVEELRKLGHVIKYYQVDVRDPDAVEKVIQEIAMAYGGIHGCITSAGVAGSAPFHEYPAVEVRRILDINLLGSYFVVQSVIRQLLKQQTPGSIVFVSSVAAHTAIKSRAVSAYGMSKAAIRGLTQHVASEYATKGIRSNSISPAPIQTDLAVRMAEGRPEILRQRAEQTMMARVGEPFEVGGAAVYLLSDASSFVTGEDILVDGGQVHQ